MRSDHHSMIEGLVSFKMSIISVWFDGGRPPVHGQKSQHISMGNVHPNEYDLTPNPGGECQLFAFQVHSLCIGRDHPMCVLCSDN